MTTINIDITNIASSTGPDDRLIFYAPHFRESTTGTVISTSPEPVQLVNGIATVELEPGPVMVRFECQGIADTGEKQGAVPDTETATLIDVLGSAFIYTPPVVNRALEDIEDARADAVADVEGEFDAQMHAWFPVETAREGMGLLWDGDGFRWSWLDQFKDTFVDDH